MSSSSLPVMQTTDAPQIIEHLNKGLDLDKDWIVRIISQVGNYEEIFEKNLGSKSPLKISRGQNALWSKGGLQYAMPIR